MSFVQTILAQLRGDNGECGARVRKNKTRNAQAAPEKRNLRKEREEFEELPAKTTKRFRKVKTGEVSEATE